MICVTGLERTIAELARRLEQYSGQLQEVRLDALDRIEEDIYHLLKLHDPLIVTCRGTAEGGLFTGTPGEQSEILHRLLISNPAYVDLETSIPLNIRRTLEHAGQNSRIITSHHQFKTSLTIRNDLLKLSDEPGDLLKYAVQVGDAAELLPLLETQIPDHRPFLRIGMGDAGMITRGLFSSFGSPWTYVTADSSTSSAPGQLTVEQAKRWRIDSLSHPAPYGLIGGPQVIHSPGMDVYNQLFAGYGVDALYLPIITARLGDTLPLLKALDFAGLSVTMPAKIAALELCDERSEEAVAAGAVNTILFNHKQFIGDNTDVTALRELLRDETGKVLILGAGGVARAALAAVGQRGIVTARDPERATAVAGMFGAATLEWEHRDRCGARTIVNATPLGMDGISSPLPAETPLADKRIIDVVMKRDGTPLTRRAKEAGAKVVDGFEIWVRQGAAQMSRFLDRKVTAGELRTLLDELHAGAFNGP
ncbi:MAG: type I 3-dehydroquinate dehydratase [bacterium]